MSKQIKLFLFLTFLQLITIIYINAQFNYNQRGGTCCCCSEYAQHPVPYSSCCGRRKRQLLSALVDFDRRLYCCSVTGRKRREVITLNKRLNNNFIFSINYPLTRS